MIYSHSNLCKRIQLYDDEFHLTGLDLFHLTGLDLFHLTGLDLFHLTGLDLFHLNGLDLLCLIRMRTVLRAANCGSMLAIIPISILLVFEKISNKNKMVSRRMFRCDSTAGKQASQAVWTRHYIAYISARPIRSDDRPSISGQNQRIFGNYRVNSSIKPSQYPYNIGSVVNQRFNYRWPHFQTSTRM